MTDRTGAATRGRWTDESFERLEAGGWLVPAIGHGLVVFTPKFESVVARLNEALTAVSPSGPAGPLWCPPVMARADIETAEYDEAFPNLLGVVNALAEPDQQPPGSVLVPVVCYSVYPRIAGSNVTEPTHFDVAGYCYRHEATSELGRLRSFRVRDFVIVAGEDEARQWRDDWITRGTEFYSGLGLKVSVQPASDPFFGATDQLLRDSQLEQQLKYEFVIALRDGPDTAIGSVNYHKEHLGSRFGIRYRDNGPAHSSCIGFGLERITLALIRAHGDDIAHWPEFAQDRAEPQMRAYSAAGSPPE